MRVSGKFKTVFFHVKAAKYLMRTCFFSIILAAMGCQTSPGPALTSSDISNLNARSTPTDYILGSGDVIELKFFYNAALDDQLTIGPDGKISPQLIGEVKAAGLPLAGLDTLLTEKYYNALGYSKKTYTLGIGDVIAVKFFYNSELNDEVPIRPDGKISLNLIDDVKAAGLTPAELDALITEKYAYLLKTENAPAVTVMVKEYKVPELSVTLRASASQKVYLGGEVAKPGMITIQGTLRSLDALILAGGALKTAQLNNVLLIRNNGSQKPDPHIIDLNKIISGELMDVRLKPYDIVYVPKTTIEQVDQFMQHIYHIIPVSALFGVQYDLNRDSTIRVE